MASKPYGRPTPAFGPGSVEYVRRQTEALELQNESDDHRTPGEPGTRADYAGAGAYY